MGHYFTYVYDKDTLLELIASGEYTTCLILVISRPNHSQTHIIFEIKWYKINRGKLLEQDFRLFLLFLF